MHRRPNQPFIHKRQQPVPKRPISSPTRKSSPFNPKALTEVNYINNIKEIHVNNIRKNITFNIFCGKAKPGPGSPLHRNLIRSEQFNTKRSFGNFGSSTYKQVRPKMVAYDEYGFKLNGESVPTKTQHPRRINLENFSIHSSLLSNQVGSQQANLGMTTSQHLNFSRSPDLRPREFQSKQLANPRQDHNEFRPKKFAVTSSMVNGIKKRPTFLHPESVTSIRRPLMGSLKLPKSNAPKRSGEFGTFSQVRSTISNEKQYLRKTDSFEEFLCYGLKVKIKRKALPTGLQNKLGKKRVKYSMQTNMNLGSEMGKSMFGRLNQNPSLRQTSGESLSLLNQPHISQRKYSKPKFWQTMGSSQKKMNVSPVLAFSQNVSSSINNSMFNPHSYFPKKKNKIKTSEAARYSEDTRKTRLSIQARRLKDIDQKFMKTSENWRGVKGGVKEISGPVRLRQPGLSQAINSLPLWDSRVIGGGKADDFMKRKQKNDPGTIGKSANWATSKGSDFNPSAKNFSEFVPYLKSKYNLTTSHTPSKQTPRNFSEKNYSQVQISKQIMKGLKVTRKTIKNFDKSSGLSRKSGKDSSHNSLFPTNAQVVKDYTSLHSGKKYITTEKKKADKKVGKKMHSSEMFNGRSRAVEAKKQGKDQFGGRESPTFMDTDKKLFTKKVGVSGGKATGGKGTVRGLDKVLFGKEDREEREGGYGDETGSDESKGIDIVDSNVINRISHEADVKEIGQNSGNDLTLHEPNVVDEDVELYYVNDQSNLDNDPDSTSKVKNDDNDNEAGEVSNLGDTGLAQQNEDTDQETPSTKNIKKLLISEVCYDNSKVEEFPIFNGDESLGESDAQSENNFEESEQRKEGEGVCIQKKSQGPKSDRNDLSGVNEGDNGVKLPELKESVEVSDDQGHSEDVSKESEAIKTDPSSEAEDKLMNSMSASETDQEQTPDQSTSTVSDDLDKETSRNSVQEDRANIVTDTSQGEIANEEPKEKSNEAQAPIIKGMNNKKKFSSLKLDITDSKPIELEGKDGDRKGDDEDEIKNKRDEPEAESVGVESQSEPVSSEDKPSSISLNTMEEFNANDDYGRKPNSLNSPFNPSKDQYPLANNENFKDYKTKEEKLHEDLTMIIPVQRVDTSDHKFNRSVNDPRSKFFIEQANKQGEIPAISMPHPVKARGDREEGVIENGEGDEVSELVNYDISSPKFMESSPPIKEEKREEEGSTDIRTSLGEPNWDIGMSIVKIQSSEFDYFGSGPSSKENHRNMTSSGNLVEYDQIIEEQELEDEATPVNKQKILYFPVKSKDEKEKEENKDKDEDEDEILAPEKKEMDQLVTNSMDLGESNLLDSGLQGPEDLEDIEINLDKSNGDMSGKVNDQVKHLEGEKQESVKEIVNPEESPENEESDVDLFNDSIENSSVGDSTKSFNQTEDAKDQDTPVDPTETKLEKQESNLFDDEFESESEFEQIKPAPAKDDHAKEEPAEEVESKLMSEASHMSNQSQLLDNESEIEGEPNEAKQGDSKMINEGEEGIETDSQLIDNDSKKDPGSEDESEIPKAAEQDSDKEKIKDLESDPVQDLEGELATLIQEDKTQEEQAKDSDPESLLVSPATSQINEDSLACVDEKLDSFDNKDPDQDNDPLNQDQAPIRNSSLLQRAMYMEPNEALSMVSETESEKYNSSKVKTDLNFKHKEDSLLGKFDPEDDEAADQQEDQSDVIIDKGIHLVELANGESFVGEVDEENRFVSGMLLSRGKDLVYAGSFVNGQKSGHGVFFYPGLQGFVESFRENGKEGRVLQVINYLQGASDEENGEQDQTTEEDLKQKLSFMTREMLHSSLSTHLRSRVLQASDPDQVGQQADLSLDKNKREEEKSPVEDEETIEYELSREAFNRVLSGIQPEDYLRYEGEFIDDLPEGFGSLYLKQGVILQSQFAKGTPEGSGMVSMTPNKALFLDSLFKGTGTLKGAQVQCDVVVFDDEEVVFWDEEIGETDKGKMMALVTEFREGQLHKIF